MCFDYLHTQLNEDNVANTGMKMSGGDEELENEVLADWKEFNRKMEL